MGRRACRRRRRARRRSAGAQRPPAGRREARTSSRTRATGEVLAGSRATRACPDREHHEADDGARRARPRAARRRRRVAPPRRPPVGESTINLRAGERITVRDLVEAALIQSANDAAGALALHVGTGDVNAFVRMMNAKARALGLRDTHFVRPDGLDVPGHVSSARDVTLLARAAMQIPFDPRDRRRPERDDLGRAAAAHVERPARDVPGRDRRQDGPHRRRGLVAGRGRPRQRVRSLRDDPRQPDALAAERRPRDAPPLGALAVRGDPGRGRDARTYGRAEVGFGKAPVALVAPRRSCARCASTGRSASASSRATAVELPVRKGQRLGDVAIYDGKRLVASSPARRRARRREAGILGRAVPGTRGQRARTEHLRRDRHRHPQRGGRPDAHRAELPARPPAPREPGPDARRRQGDQRRARAQAARRPRCRDRARGRRTGTRIVEELTVRGDPQRLRPHRRRVAHVDSCRRPDGQHVHGDQRVGAARRARRARDAAARSCDYLSRGADAVVFAGSLPRGVEDRSTPRRSAS